MHPSILTYQYAQVSLGAVARAHSLALTRWADLIDTLDKGRTATPEFYAQLARFELELIYENVKYGGSRLSAFDAVCDCLLN
jgi:hypothetical protein